MRPFLVRVLLSALCACAAKPSLHLLSVVIDRYEDEREPIRIRFSGPVAAETDVGKAIEKPPIHVSPHLEVAAHWEDRQTLVVRPLAAPAPSTRYAMELTGPLAGKVAGASLSFDYRPLAVLGVSGADLMHLPPSPVLFLSFNQPVLQKDVAEKCFVGEREKRIPLVVEGKEVDAAFTVRPAAPLALDRDHELSCANIFGQGGNIPMPSPYVAAMHSYPGFRVVEKGPTGNNIGADEVKLTIRFSSPMRLDEIRQAVSANPPVPAFADGWLDANRTTYSASVDLETETTYLVTIASTLGDAYGKRLGEKNVEWSFRTGDAKPSLSFENGIYTVESSSSVYPVWTRNVSSMEVECGRVPWEKTVKLLTSDMNYDPWYDAASETVNWKTYGVVPRKHRLPVNGTKNKWQLANLALPQLCAAKDASKGGLFLAEIRAPEVQKGDEWTSPFTPHPRVLANITDLGVLLKVGPASGLVWVTSLGQGSPVGGAKVTVFTPKGKSAFSGTTDDSGLLRIPGADVLLERRGKAQDEIDGGGDGEDEIDGDMDGDVDGDMDGDWYYRPQRLIAVVEKAGDVAVVDGNWQNGIQVWNFGVPQDRGPGVRAVRGFIQSDRGIYRPGETVQFKGLVRVIEAGQPPRVPERKKIAVHIEDSRGNALFDRALTLTTFGGFAFALPLGPEANVGDYHVTATLEKQSFRESFQVEEFRKVEFDVALSGIERDLRLGGRVDVTASARYLFGAPLKGGDVSWSVVRRRHNLAFPALENYNFADTARAWLTYRWDYDYGYSAVVSDGEGVTDGQGRFRFSFRDTEEGVKGPADYLIRATVKDETGQAVSKLAVATAHPTDFYLGIHAQEFVQAVDMPFAINAVAVAPGGTQVATQARLAVVKHSRSCRYEGDYISRQICTSKKEPVFTRELDIPATGATVEHILLKEPGDYEVRIVGKDGRRRQVIASQALWVIGRGEAFWSGDESARMSVIASKNEYRPGETARLALRSSIPSGLALVTLERNGILDAFVEPVTSGEGIELPLDVGHAPNVFASVALVKGRTGAGDRDRPRFQMGVVDLKVAAHGQELRVEVLAERETYKPGEQVKGTVRVTSAEGQPATAEVSLSAADEGVLKLIDYKTPNPMASFYASWGLGVDSATNLNRVARINDPNATDFEEGGDGAGEEVRSRFVSSAYWAPALVTDARGEISFSFVAPDSLTTFRIMVVAADQGHRFGAGEGKIVVTKRLVAQPIVPRFLRAGDELEVGALIHNRTEVAGEATVTLSAKGLKLAGKTRKVRVSAGGSVPVRFGAKVLEARKATLDVAVTLGGDEDRVKIELPIERAIVVERQVLARGMTAQGAIAIPISWQSDLLVGDSTLEITVDRLGLGEIADGLRYLIEYPYGCLEQTLSGLIPLAKVKDLAESLDLGELRGPKLNAFLKAGVAKLGRFQHEDGNFSLWPAGATYPHLTAYALYGLAEVRRAGVTVDEKVVKSAIGAVRNWALGASRTLAPGGESGTMALAAFVLADLGAQDSGLNARLYEARKGLPIYGQALLLRALAKAKGAPAQIETLINEIARSVIEAERTAMVKERHGDELYFDSDARSTAIVLSALVETSPKHHLVDKLVYGLKAARRGDGRWASTNDTAWVLSAFADYARARGVGTLSASVSLGGKTLANKKLRKGGVFAVRKPLGQAKPGELLLKTDGPAHYLVSLRAAKKRAALEPVNKGFRVERQILDADTGTPVTELKIGQLVKIRVSVSADSPHRWVAIADHLPSGLEALNMRLATTEKAEQRTFNRLDHLELRDERAMAFLDHMLGPITFAYLARATTPGSFTVPPVSVEAMYEPEVLGQSAPLAIKVTR